jgi:hypothetical protein
LIILRALAGDGRRLFEFGDLLTGGLELCPAACDLGLQLLLACLVFLVWASGLALFGEQAGGIRSAQRR